MSIRIECPQCESSFRVEEGLSGKTVCCKNCGAPFRAESLSETDEAIQPTPTRSGPARSKPITRALSSRQTAPGPRSSSLVLAGLVGGGIGLLLLGLAGVGAYFFLASSNAQPGPALPVAQAIVDPAPAEPIVNAAPPGAPKAPVVPPAVAKVPDAPAGNGKETFVDLPERGQDLPEIAGVTFGPGDKAPRPRNPDLPPGKPPVTLADDPLPARPPAGWEQHVQPEKAYALWLPKAVQELVQEEGTTQVKDDTIKYTLLQCEIKDNVNVKVLVLNLPVKKGQQVDATTVLETFRDLYLREDEGTIVGEYNTAVGNLLGKEYRIDLKSGAKTRLRLFFGSPTIYQLSVTGTKEQIEGEAAKLILGSFKHAGMVREMMRK